MTDAEKYQEAFIAYTTDNLHEPVAPPLKDIAKRFDLPIEGLKIKLVSGGWDLERDKNRADFVAQVKASSTDLVSQQADSYTSKVKSILEARIENYIIVNDMVNEQVVGELEHKDMDVKNLIALKKIMMAEGNALLNIVAALKQMEDEKNNPSGTKKAISMEELPNVLGMKMVKPENILDEDDGVDEQRMDILDSLGEGD